MLRYAYSYLYKRRMPTFKGFPKSRYPTPDHPTLNSWLQTLDRSYPKYHSPLWDKTWSQDSPSSDAFVDPYQQPVLREHSQILQGVMLKRYPRRTWIESNLAHGLPLSMYDYWQSAQLRSATAATMWPNGTPQMHQPYPVPYMQPSAPYLQPVMPNLAASSSPPNQAYSKEGIPLSTYTTPAIPISAHAQQHLSQPQPQPQSQIQGCESHAYLLPQSQPQGYVPQPQLHPHPYSQPMPMPQPQPQPQMALDQSEAVNRGRSHTRFNKILAPNLAIAAQADSYEPPQLPINRAAEPTGQEVNLTQTGSEAMFVSAPPSSLAPPGPSTPPNAATSFSITWSKDPVIRTHQAYTQQFATIADPNFWQKVPLSPEDKRHLKQRYQAAQQAFATTDCLTFLRSNTSKAPQTALNSEPSPDAASSLHTPSPFQGQSQAQTQAKPQTKPQVWGKPKRNVKLLMRLNKIGSLVHQVECVFVPNNPLKPAQDSKTAFKLMEDSAFDLKDTSHDFYLKPSPNGAWMALNALKEIDALAHKEDAASATKAETAKDEADKINSELAKTDSDADAAAAQAKTVAAKARGKTQTKSRSKATTKTAATPEAQSKLEALRGLADLPLARQLNLAKTQDRGYDDSPALGAPADPLSLANLSAPWASSLDLHEISTPTMGQTTLLPNIFLENTQAQPILIEQERVFEHFTLVQVVVNHPLFKSFDYKISGRFDHSLVGCRVRVSFGAGKKRTEIGIVLKEIPESSYPLIKLKSADLIDSKPLIPIDILQTLLYGADYYHYPVGQVLPLALPKLLRDGGNATYKEIPGLQSLVAPENLEKSLNALNSLALKELLLDLQSGPKRRRELREKGYTASQENSLVKKGFAHKIDLANGDLKPTPSPKTPEDLYLTQPLQLNEEQRQALERINNFEGYGVFVLNGVTGSGKTEVYLQAIAHTLLQGKQALILVPEIALTPQTFKRFYQRFKVPIATLHSTLSARERLDGFLDMRNEQALILIGTRSALFTPIPNLGLIVIDEEHDSSFKQGDGFRYHTRTLALYRAQLRRCKVILGSATPSLETLYHVEQGHYAMLRLRQRAKTAQVPTIQIVDIRKEPITSGRKSGIGLYLEQQIGYNTVRHYQSILFINRRGYSNQMLCGNCDQTIQCPYCDVPMTVHRNLGKMICHICNTQQPIPTICPHCGSNDLYETGAGTEQVEDYLQTRFMDVGVERIDRDSISSKRDLDRALEQIHNHSSEIIVGTQMLAKGHDFPDVTLVGILNVDAGLYSDDFRALEQTIQLITQVAGRAGRSKKKGLVIIQTVYPDHQMLLRITEPDFDYTKVASDLLYLRRSMNLPPYSHQAVLIANALERKLPGNFLEGLVDDLSEYAELLAEVSIGPVLPDRIERRINRYHYHCVITSTSQEALKKLLYAVVNLTQRKPIPKELRFAIDVDPFNSP